MYLWFNLAIPISVYWSENLFLAEQVPSIFKDHKHIVHSTQPQEQISQVENESGARSKMTGLTILRPAWSESLWWSPSILISFAQIFQAGLTVWSLVLRSPRRWSPGAARWWFQWRSGLQVFWYRTGYQSAQWSCSQALRLSKSIWLTYFFSNLKN